MGRKGITLEDVSHAAESLRNEGQQPTVDRVREFLGTGSKTTITPLLRLWRQQQTESVDLSELPEGISKAVVALHKQLHSVAQQRIDNNEEKLDQERTRWSETLGELRQSLLEEQAKSKTLEEKLQATEEREIGLHKSLQAHQVQLARAETQRDAALDENNKLQTLQLTQQQELGSLREQFEHYQERASEERQREREEFHRSRLQLEDNINNQRRSLEQASSLNTHLQQELSSYRSQQEELHQRQTEQAATIEKLKTQNGSLSEKLTASTGIQKELSKQVTDLQDDIKKAHIEIAATRASNAQKTDQTRLLTEQFQAKQHEAEQLVASKLRLEFQLEGLQKQIRDIRAEK